MRLIDADAPKQRVDSMNAVPQTLAESTSPQDSNKEWETGAPRIMTRDELLAAEYSKLSEEDKARYIRCRAIPDIVVKLCGEEYGRLRVEVMERESQMDTICDFLNGYDMTPEIPF